MIVRKKKQNVGSSLTISENRLKRMGLVCDSGRQAAIMGCSAWVELLSVWMTGSLFQWSVLSPGVHCAWHREPGSRKGCFIQLAYLGRSWALCLPKANSVLQGKEQAKGWSGDVVCCFVVGEEQLEKKGPKEGLEGKDIHQRVQESQVGLSFRPVDSSANESLRTQSQGQPRQRLEVASVLWGQ